MRKLLSILTVIVVILSSTTCALAQNGEISVYLEGYSGTNGEKIAFDVPPQTINDRTMVPIRAIFEAMGASVEWDDATKTATAVKDKTIVKMTLDSTKAFINDKAFAMDVSPIIIDGRALAPARYVAEAFGYNVSWDQNTRSVLIGKSTDYSASKTQVLNKENFSASYQILKNHLISNGTHSDKYYIILMKMDDNSYVATGYNTEDNSIYLTTHYEFSGMTISSFLYIEENGKLYDLYTIGKNNALVKFKSSGPYVYQSTISKAFADNNTILEMVKKDLEIFDIFLSGNKIDVKLSNFGIYY